MKDTRQFLDDAVAEATRLDLAFQALGVVPTYELERRADEAYMDLVRLCRSPDATRDEIKQSFLVWMSARFDVLV